LKPEGNLAKIELIAGRADGDNSFGADGDAATARLDRPTSVVTDAKGDYYIIEGNGLRVRKVDRATKTITTVAGTGQRGFFGDGGPAIGAWLDSPAGIAVDNAGNVLFADSSNNRLRVVHCAAEPRTAIGSSCAAPTSSLAVGSRVLVTWSVTGVSSCAASGAWSGDKLNTGSEWVTLSAAGEKNFALTCKSFSGATSTFSTPVSVAPAPVGEPKVTVTTSSALVKSGSTVRLTWSSVNAISCAKAGAWTGSAALSGSEESAPLSTTATFEIRCTGATGLIRSGSAKVEVVASAPVIGKFISTPAGGVPLGDSVVLNWETTGAQRCEASNGWQGVQATKGTFQTPPLVAPTTYVLTCTNPAGSTSKSVSLTLLSSDPFLETFRVSGPSAGVISTVMGNGPERFSGDGGLAKSAGLAGVYSVAVDSAGNVWVGGDPVTRVRLAFG
jgi:hypothetical protein